jgi:hypothetical protein
MYGGMTANDEQKETQKPNSKIMKGCDRKACGISIMAPYSLYSARLLTRTLWAIVKSSVLNRERVPFGMYPY